MLLDNNDDDRWYIVSYHPLIPWRFAVFDLVTTNQLSTIDTLGSSISTTNNSDVAALQIVGGFQVALKNGMHLTGLYFLVDIVEIRVWHVLTRKTTSVFRVHFRHYGGSYQDVQLLPWHAGDDGSSSLVLAISNGTTVYFVNLAQQCLLEKKFVFSPTTAVVAVLKAAKIKIDNNNNNSTVSDIDCNTTATTNRDERKLIGVERRKSVYLWDFDTEQCIFTQTEPAGGIKLALCTLAGAFIIIGTYSPAWELKVVRIGLNDADQQKQQQQTQVERLLTKNCCSWQTTDSELLLLDYTSGMLHCYDLVSDTDTACPTRKIAVTPPSSVIANSCHSDENIQRPWFQFSSSSSNSNSRNQAPLLAFIGTDRHSQVRILDWIRGHALPHSLLLSNHRDKTAPRICERVLLHGDRLVMLFSKEERSQYWLEFYRLE